MKFRNLRLPLRHPNLLPFPNQHSKQPKLLRLPIGSPGPQQTLRRALLIDCRLRYPNPLLLLHGSTKRSHRKQMKLPCRRLRRRPTSYCTASSGDLPCPTIGSGDRGSGSGQRIAWQRRCRNGRGACQGLGVSPGGGEPPEPIVIEAAQPPVPEAPAPPPEP